MVALISGNWAHHVIDHLIKKEKKTIESHATHIFFFFFHYNILSCGSALVCNCNGIGSIFHTFAVGPNYTREREKKFFLNYHWKVNKI